jgi:cystathionine beta-lyase/cystathionine gamma-synthase
VATKGRNGRRYIENSDTEALIEGSLEDLLVDLDELAYLVVDAEAKLARLSRDLVCHAADLRDRTLDLLVKQACAEQGRYRQLGDELLRLSLRATAATSDPRSLIAELEEGRASLADLLRSQRAITAALIVAADWQSPSFMHSTVAAAGRQGGRITPHWNDYKRDRNLDAEAFERAYLREMVDGPADLRALLTGCGMAAFTTILNFLQLEGRLDAPALVGTGVYHESRELLERALPCLVREVDERDTTALVATARELRPSAIFLDSLANTGHSPLPDLEALVPMLPPHTYLVLDNTGLSTAFQPFVLASQNGASSGGRVIVFESLLKYAQLGLDRANAGIIVARAREADALADYREHLGTNASDFAAHAMPTPNRQVLERRLAHLERNAALIARRLEATLASAPMSAVEGVFYPGLRSHPCHAVARRHRFRGGCVSIAFRPRADLALQRAFLETAIAEARERGVALLAGSSFGFDVTRIYLTAARFEQKPFVRVAAGTEHRVAAEKVADALASALWRVVKTDGRHFGRGSRVGNEVVAA